MSEAPLVSVIIPAYQTEKYIDRCLSSLREQTYPNLEFIVVDDGSADGTGAICDKYAALDSRFQVIHKENTGVSASRNLGLARSRGKYLIFVDSDDYVKPDYVQTLAAQADEGELVCAEYFCVEHGVETKHPSILGEQEKRCLSSTEAIDLLPDERAFRGYLWNKLFWAEVIRREGLCFDTDIKIWEDMLFCLRYLTKVRRCVYVGVPLYDYVIRDGSAMTSGKTWSEYTHVTALARMWEIAEQRPGAFHNFIRDLYARNLVAQLGKPGYQDPAAVENILRTVRKLHGHLPVRHWVKYCLFKYGKGISGSIRN